MRSVIGLGLFGSIVSLGALLSAHHRFFDLLSHFRVQYIVLITVVICVALFYKKYLATAVLAVCLAIHSFDVYRSQHAIEIAGTFTGTSIRVMNSNLLATNTLYDKHCLLYTSPSPRDRG